MGKANCKNPDATPTKRQTWAVFCMTGVDIRNCDLNREEVSNMIGDLKSKGEHFLPEGKYYTDKLDNQEDFICTKEKLREVGDKLWKKSGRENPLSVGAVVKHKKKNSGTTKNDFATSLIAKADEAGSKAMAEIKGKVAPMVVEQHANPLNDNSPVEKAWIIEGGACGWATVRVKCTNATSRKFINELKKKGLAGDQNSFKQWTKSDYHGGFLYSLSLIGGQSLAYKEAYGYAFVKVLEDAGVNAYLISRLD